MDHMDHDISFQIFVSSMVYNMYEVWEHMGHIFQVDLPPIGSKSLCDNAFYVLSIVTHARICKRKTMDYYFNFKIF